VARPRKRKIPPSRLRYEQTHRVFSVRLDEETFTDLNNYLKSAGCSRADFVKNALGKERDMIKKRIEELASREVDPSLEEKVRFLSSLVLDIREYPPLCPRCEDQEMRRCEGREIESKIGYPWVLTWKCPKCGFFMDTYHRIDPKSLTWLEDYSKKDDHKKSVSPKPQKKRK
jgi:hypothetical protein